MTAELQAEAWPEGASGLWQGDVWAGGGWIASMNIIRGERIKVDTMNYPEFTCPLDHYCTSKRRKGRLSGTKVTGGAKPAAAEPLASCRYLVVRNSSCHRAERTKMEEQCDDWWEVARQSAIEIKRGVILSQTISSDPIYPPQNSCLLPLPAPRLPIMLLGSHIIGTKLMSRINVPPGLDLPGYLGFRKHDIMAITATTTS